MRDRHPQIILEYAENATVKQRQSIRVDNPQQHILNDHYQNDRMLHAEIVHP